MDHIVWRDISTHSDSYSHETGQYNHSHNTKHFIHIS